MSKAKSKKICIFRNDLFQAGGIETWLYNIAYIYGKTHDITIYYDTGDKEQIYRLARLVKCKRYEGQDIKCDVAIWCYDFLGYETTKAKRKIHVIHADYSHKYNFGFNIPFAKTMGEIYASSGIAAKSASKIFGFKIEPLYNPVVPVTEKKPLKILSATRLSHEKGLWRMKLLAKELDRAGVDYTWEIFTPSYKSIELFSPNVILKKPVMSILKNIKKADFVVQLSDTESFGYSIVETMATGTNLVVTDIPVLKELGINKENAIVVPLNTKRYKKIVSKIIARSPYVPPKSDWLKVLGPPTIIHYNPTIVKNISRGDVMIDDDHWLEPGQVMIIEDYKHDNPCLKEVK